jgi:uncharacterized protein YjbI with pentapeptide repeats
VLTNVQTAVWFCELWLVTFVQTRGNLFRAVAISLVGTFIVALIFCIPDSWQDRLGREVLGANVPFGTSNAQRVAFWPTAFFLESKLNHATGRPFFWISRNLVVVDDNSRRERATPELALPSERSSDKDGFSLRDRNLRYAILDRSNLRGVDLTAADLSGASLLGTDLRGAKIGCIKAERGWSDRYIPVQQLSESTVWEQDFITRCTLFIDALLTGADFRNTTFVSQTYVPAFPSLEGLSMMNIKLDGADLTGVDLSGADLSFATLIGTNLERSSLIAANFTGADLTAANLHAADATLSTFGFARLYGANLLEARLTAANLGMASLAGAVLAETELIGASLRYATVWITSPPPKKNLAWADLYGLKIRAPSAAMLADIRKVIEQLGAPQQSEAQKRLRALVEVRRDEVADDRGGPGFRDSLAARLRWILGSIMPPISPRLPA